MDYATTPLELQLAINEMRWVSLNRKYFVKFVHMSDLFLIVITDLIKVWFRYADAEQIKRDNNKYCPHLQIPVHELLVSLKERILEPHKEDTTLRVSIDEDTNELKLKINSKLEVLHKQSLPFKWAIYCTPMKQSKPVIALDEQSQQQELEMPTAYTAPKSHSEFLRDQVIFPLLGITNVLYNEIEEFKRIIKQKDEELLFFRELHRNDSSMRKRFSPPFDNVKHESEMFSPKKLVQEFSNGCDLSFNDSATLQNLYISYMKYKYNVTNVPKAPSQSQIVNLDDTQGAVILEQKSQQQQQQQQGEAEFDGDIGGGNQFGGEEAAEGSQAAATTSTTTTVEHIADSQASTYEESAEEKKRKRELENMLEEKKKKKEQKQKKAKIKKAFL